MATDVQRCFGASLGFLCVCVCVCVFKTPLSSERIHGQRAKTLRKTMRERVQPFENSKNPHAKWAVKPSTFGALFLSFGGVERARA